MVPQLYQDRSTYLLTYLPTQTHRNTTEAIYTTAAEMREFFSLGLAFAPAGFQILQGNQQNRGEGVEHHSTEVRDYS